MYAQGGVTSCSSPAPTACKMTVDLLTPSITVGVLASNHSNWVPCKGLKVDAKFTCHTTPGKSGFYSQVTLQTEVGTAYDSDTINSGTVEYFCQT